MLALIIVVVSCRVCFPFEFLKLEHQFMTNILLGIQVPDPMIYYPNGEELNKRNRMTKRGL